MPGRFDRIMRDIDRGMTDDQIARRYRKITPWDAQMYRRVHDGKISPGHDEPQDE